MVFIEPIQVGFQPFHSHPAGVLVVAIALQRFDDDKMQWCPAIGIGPLCRHAAEYELAKWQSIGRRQATLALKTAEGLDQSSRLFVVDHAGPHRKVCRQTTD